MYIKYTISQLILYLDQITKCRNAKHIVFSDFQSAIVAIEKKKISNPLIAELHTNLNNLCNKKKKSYYAGYQVTLESREMK